MSEAISGYALATTPLGSPRVKLTSNDSLDRMGSKFKLRAIDLKLNKNTQ
jgi:hypothetical protein